MNLDGSTNLGTLQAETRKMLNSCDLGGFNSEFFLTSALVDDIADFIQEKEREAFKRGQYSMQKV